MVDNGNNGFSNGVVKAFFPNYNKDDNGSKYFDSVRADRINPIGTGGAAFVEGLGGALWTHMVDQESGKLTGGGNGDEEIEALKEEINTIANALDEYDDKLADITNYTEEEIEKIYEGFDEFRNDLNEYSRELDEHEDLTEERIENFYEEIEDKFYDLEEELKEMGEKKTPKPGEIDQEDIRKLTPYTAKENAVKFGHKNLDLIDELIQREEVSSEFLEAIELLSNYSRGVQDDIRNYFEREINNKED